MRGSSQGYFSFPTHGGHNAWLDALRSLAIVLVLLRHGIRVPVEGFSFGGFLENVFTNGWIGVDLFFVLSGYLIAKSLLKQMGSGGEAFSWRYFEARILRIVPAYYVVLMLCVVGYFPFFYVQPAGLDMRIFYHFLFLQDYLGADINVVFWSLGVEEKFYILVPLLILCLLKFRSPGRQLTICLALLAISPVARAVTFVAADASISYETFFRQMRSPFHMSLEGFLAGVIIALGQTHGWTMRPQIAKPTLLLCLGGLLAWSGSHEFLGQITLFDAAVQPLLLAAVFGLMLSCCLALATVPLSFEPAARITARLSYALYLVHFPIIPLALALSVKSGTLAFWCVYLLLSACMAIATHFFVEKPFLLLKDSRAKRHHSGTLKSAEVR